ncbi:DegT/DnrJ/EryC1/StrS aminotransferase family protein [Brucepastera parasyntrophica]|uniref:DegT/DnrJ/EryC1/StrS family aminotransferase n=1 Tax=Brucepastera parasyntrophica TaxID=2880008 RepID=UPI00210DC567|nr:DegT/DnrJ/EryC1/StrS aminotransferase family protein [Brucepastera parasyntrophica]ULQ59650.1 DegT/DnrJ/EryC1/StrS aminotransferase family protein [Brucepastera parasyntrophica]
MKLPVYSSTIRRKEMDAVLTCMVAEKIGPGEMNQKLAQLVREVFGTDGAAAFRSSAIALQYALKALDLTPGSGIIISALAPAWQYQAVTALGYSPVTVDVDPDTACVTPDAIEKAIARGGRLILLHETLGVLPDIDSILAFNIPVIEDISQSAGASFGEKKAGQFGVFSILGLEERDMITGGGGALLLAPNRREAIVLKRLADEAPLTDILPDINSALAFVQVRELQRNIEMRRQIYEGYVHSLLQGRHKTISQNESVSPSFYCFPVILASGFKEVKQYANRKDIQIEPAFTDSVVTLLGEDLPDCVNAKSLAMRCVLFPLYPRLGAANAAKIAKVLATLP